MKKIIAIALALVLCTCMMSVAAFADNTVTVHAQVPADWAEVAAYTWEPDSLGGWPGTVMTKNGDWYEVQMGAEQLKLIINNNDNGKQTADLNIEAGKEIWVVVADDLSAQIYYEDPANGGEAVVPETPELPADASYYVAGVEALCGVNWSENAEANKMTLNADGLYEKVYENVAAGEYALKVTAGSWDFNWGGEGPDGNYVFTVAEAGTVVVLFDAENEVLTVEVNGAAPEQPEEKPEENPAPETPADATYYVAGVEALCGVNWSENAEANKMSLNSDGLYEKVYENVAAGDYQLKVTDGTWANCWGTEGNPDGNYMFTVTEPGNVAVLFDAENKIVIVEVNGSAAQEPEQKPEEKPEEKPEQKPEAPADATYIVAGVGSLCGAEWDPAAEANKMTKSTDGTYTKTYSNVPAGSYSIKVTDGSWANSWGGDGENGNFDFTVSAAGDVVVKFNPATNEVSVSVNGESVKTGDVSLAAVSVALLAATAGLVAIVSKKED